MPKDESAQRERVLQMAQFDKKMRRGKYLAGVDEAGRGPLAGPVYAAAVVLMAISFVLCFSVNMYMKRKEE